MISQRKRNDSLRIACNWLMNCLGSKILISRLAENCSKEIEVYSEGNGGIYDKVARNPLILIQERYERKREK